MGLTAAKEDAIRYDNGRTSAILQNSEEQSQKQEFRFLRFTGSKQIC